MANLAHAHIYYPSTIGSDGTLGTNTTNWFDLRTVIASSTVETIGSTVTCKVRIRGFPPETTLIWPKTEFETAKALSLAATGG